MSQIFLKKKSAFENVNTGGAWLSSARVVRCWVKSRNERNPCFQLPFMRNSKKTAGYKPEEGGDDVKSACPLHPGLHTCYIGRDNEMQICKDQLIYKLVLSSDCRLQLAYMKLESLVIAGQLYSGEFVPGPCTHRPSHHGSWLCPKSLL